MAVAAGAAVVAGTIPFAAVVVVTCAALLVDFAAALAAAGPRPVIPLAAVPGLGLPAVVITFPDAGWTAIPPVVAVGLLATFVTVLVSGRRRDVTGALGSTMVAGLVVGLGGAGLLLLGGLEEGPRWVLALLAVVGLVELVRAIVSARMRPLTAAGATVTAALVAAGTLAVALAPPFGVATASGVAALALLAGPAAGVLHEAVDGEAPAEGTRRGAPRGRIHVGVLTVAALPILLSAPAAYALARIAVL